MFFFLLRVFLFSSFLSGSRDDMKGLSVCTLNIAAPMQPPLREAALENLRASGITIGLQLCHKKGSTAMIIKLWGKLFQDGEIEEKPIRMWRSLGGDG